MKALVLLQRPPCQRLRPQARFEVNRRKAAALRPRWLAPPQAVAGGFRSIELFCEKNPPLPGFTRRFPLFVT